MSGVQQYIPYLSYLALNTPREPLSDYQPLKHRITTNTLSGPGLCQTSGRSRGTSPGSFSASHWPRVAALRPPFAPGTNFAAARMKLNKLLLFLVEGIWLLTWNNSCYFVTRDDVNIDLFGIQEIFPIFSKWIKVTATQFCPSTMLYLDIVAALLSILKI